MFSDVLLTECQQSMLEKITGRARRSVEGRPGCNSPGGPSGAIVLEEAKEASRFYGTKLFDQKCEDRRR